MAFPPRVQLSQARLSVAIRCGQATGNYVPANLTPIIDEKLRQAHAYLWAKCWWTRNLVRQWITLVPSVGEYDFPDNISAEGVTNIAVERAVDLRLYDLSPGIRTSERNTAINSGRPMRYTFENQALVIFQPPDANWSRLAIDGYYAPGEFTAEDAEAVVDKEALIAYGEILVKGHFSMPTDESKEAFEGYLSNLRSRQSDGEGFQLGGKQSWKVKAIPQNRILGTRYGNNVSGPDWSPPGWG